MENEEIHDVVIVGGSLSGLFNGVLLKQAGHDVTILDRSLTDVRESQAAGIGVSDQVRKLFEKAKIPWDDLGPECSEVQLCEGVDGELKVQRQIPWSGIMTNWSVVYYRLRAHFDGFISEVCPQQAPETNQISGHGAGLYKTGHKVTSIEHRRAEKCVIVHYENLHTDKSASLKARLVIGADGGYSVVRPHVYSHKLQRKYAGYFAWRGTFSLSQLSSSGREIFKPGIAPFAISPKHHTTLATYNIPADNGKFGPSEGLINIVWYDNCPRTSPFYDKAMTDIDGRVHNHTLPPGKMNPQVWAVQCERASRVFPAPFDEIITNVSKRPFITAISDLLTPECVFWDGRVVLVGEALCVARPHTGNATNEAARQALLLSDVLEGKLNWRGFSRQVMGAVRLNFYAARAFGLTYLGGRLARWWAILEFTWAKIRHKIVNLLS